AGLDRERAHRVAWALAPGPVPAQHRVIPACGNRGCCRPNHLELRAPVNDDRGLPRARPRYWPASLRTKALPRHRGRRATCRGTTGTGASSSALPQTREALTPSPARVSAFGPGPHRAVVRAEPLEVLAHELAAAVGVSGGDGVGDLAVLAHDLLVVRDAVASGPHLLLQHDEDRLGREGEQPVAADVDDGG